MKDALSLCIYFFIGVGMTTTLCMLSHLVQEPLMIKKEPMAFLPSLVLGSILLSPDSDFVGIEPMSQTDPLSLSSLTEAVTAEKQQS